MIESHPSASAGRVVHLCRCGCGGGNAMSDEKTVLKGPDLTQGIELSRIADGTMLLGHARGEPVLLARRGDELFAIGAICTHYGAPLETGLLVGDTVCCPWHHACFSLSTGEALRAPALAAVSCWRVSEVRDAARQFTPAEQPVGAVYVSEKLERIAPHLEPARVGMPPSVLIVGGGAAGNAAAETLRREGYGGPITMVSADDALPCDRPNLSKGYLAGTASEASNLLRSTKFYQNHGIDVRSARRWPRSIPAAVMSSWRMASAWLMARCSSPPAPTRCGSMSRAVIWRTCIICARLRTA